MSQLPLIKVLIVDDHPLAQEGLRNFLSAFPDLHCMGAVDSGEQALAFCEREEPDVVLMDLLMPGIGGIEATRLLTERHPEVEVIALTSGAQDDLIRQVMRVNASGYLVKTAPAHEMAYAIRTAKHGRAEPSGEADRPQSESAPE